MANLGWCVNNVAGAYARYTLVANPGALPASGLAVWLSSPWPGVLSTGVLTLAILLFPDGRLPSPRWRPAAWWLVATTVGGALVLAFAPGTSGAGTPGVEVANPLGLPGAVGRVLAWLSAAVLPLGLLSFAVAVFALLRRFWRAAGAERAQLKWIVSALAVQTVVFAMQAALFVGFGSLEAMPAWARLLNQVGVVSHGVLFPVAAGIAILRYRLYDIDVLINRALVYGALTATLAVVYFGGVALLQQGFRAATGARSNLAVVASTLAIAALFQPLRRRFQAAIDHRFYRRKYDAQQTLAAFGAALRDETDLEQLSARLVGAVQETMQPAHVSLWLRPPEQRSAIREEAV